MERRRGNSFEGAIGGAVYSQEHGTGVGSFVMIPWKGGRVSHDNKTVWGVGERIDLGNRIKISTLAFRLL